MDIKRLREKLELYLNALERLKESLDMEPASPVIKDGVIQRFEFTYELGWKLMKAYLEYQGITEGRTPREVYKESFRAAIILNGDAWLDMMTDRNLTSYTYDEKMADEIYTKIKNKHYDVLLGLGERIKKEVDL